MAHLTFIHGISNVAFAVLAFNAQLPHVDIYNQNPGVCADPEKET